MEIPPNWLDIVMRMLSATILCGIIGLEREVRDKSAGLRTHMLVGLGAAGFCVFAIELMNGIATDANASFDPLRIVGGVIGGLGFLGAGAIMKSDGDIYGMTTAAGIWVAGAIGVGCGTGNYFAVCVFTFIAFVCILPIRFLEHRLNAAVEAVIEENGSEDE